MGPVMGLVPLSAETPQIPLSLSPPNLRPLHEKGAI